jgi:acetyl esterase/lipase
MVSLPAIFASISYRLAPGFRYPDPLYDCFSALKWVYGNIERYGGNPQRLFIGGHSAGGHLTTLVALRRDIAESRGLPSNVIKGCYPVSTPFDLRIEKPEPGSGEERVYPLFLRKPEDAADASPIVHIKDNETPFFITYGSRDLEWVLRTGPPMISALQKQPGRVEHHVFEGSDHFQINLDQGNENNLWVKKVRSWMTEH